MKFVDNRKSRIRLQFNKATKVNINAPSRGIGKQNNKHHRQVDSHTSAKFISIK